MRSALLRLFIGICFIYFSNHLSAQNCFNTGLNGTVINLPCNQNCVNVPVRIPHLRSSSDYALTTVPYNPFTWVTATGTEDPNIYNDDRYSTMFNLPFPFCFYDSLFTKVSVGSNGIITFDHGLQACNVTTLTAAWNIANPIPYNSGLGSCDGTITNYPKAAIMAVFQDLDPRPGPTSTTTNSSPPDRKIEWRVEGTAPCRKFIVSYYKIGVFISTACGLATPATFQIVIYESTGLIDIYIQNKVCAATSTNGAKAILGIQNWNRDKALAAPGKNATAWTSSNEGYRFVPSGGASRFVSCVVQTLGGTPIATGDTTTTVAGTLDVTFPTFCPTGATGQYVIKTTFSACDNAANQIISYDTITINKTTSLNATAATTQTACGASGSGTATITVPPGLGTPPYTFVLNPVGTTLTGNSPQTFTGLNAGSYTVVVTDGGGCSSTIPITITSTGVLAVTYTTTNTTCVGATNGSIVVNPPNGTPPITYSINGGPFTTNNTFSNLGPGTYFISTHDNAGCQANLIPVTITAGPSITMTTSTTNTSCPGAANGSITITGATGTAPYLYSINGGPYQSNNTFTGLVAGTYFISLADATGCTITFIPVTVSDGPGNVTGTATSTPPSCTGATNGTVTVTATSGSGPYQYSINGGPYQSSNVFTGLAPGSYTVIIKEAGLCTSAAIPVTVGAGGALLATATSATTSCNGAADGTITITPTNGSAPYQYSLDGGPNQPGNIFTGVSSGSHNVIVRDASGCVSAAIPVTVTAGPALTGTATSTATACTGVNNGTITATATNGTGPYQYSLDGGAPQASNTFTGVSSGSHNVVIRNSAGCISANIPVTVAVGTALAATTNTTSTACVGVNNGSITVTPTNGTAPYQYSLDGGAFQAGNTFTNVSAGSHNVVFRDNFGCVSAAIPVTVAAGTALTATSTSTSTACVGVNNGSITITPTNGSAPYQYSLDGGANQASNIFTGVSAGSHNVVVTDNLGCISAPIPVTVAAGTALTATSTSTSTACAGVNNGSITITPTNGSAPYQYSLDGGANQASNIFTGVAAGPHNVVVRDNFGCVSAPMPVTVATGAALTGTASSTATTCNGASNGTITATATNGSGPYQYSLDGGANQASNIFNGVSSGSHNVVIRDNFGCISAAIPVTVTAGSALNATTSMVSTSCSGASNGSITVTAPTNGTAPYQYSLNGGAPQASPIFNGLAAAAYTINVTDNGGCSSGNIPVTVIAGPPISETLGKTDATCFGSATGSITATPSANATGPIQYSLNNVTWQASPNFTALAANTYTVYIRDAVGCSNSAIITVGQPSQLQATTSQQSVLCNSGNNGKIVVAATGGTTPYSYSLNGAAYQPNNTFNVAAGVYTVDVRDAAGCNIATIANITVTEPASLTAAPATTNATCNGGSDGTINITPAGGVSPYQYAITGGGFQATSNFNVGPGTYDVTVKDVNGCSYTVTGIVVGLTNNLTYTPMIDPAPICESKNVQLQLVTNANQFVWTGAGLSSTSVPNPVAQPSSTTTYNVTATLGRCTITDNVVVTIMPAPIPDAGPAGDICYGKSYQLQGSGGTIYTWTPSAYLSSTSVSNPVVTPEKTITYILSVIDANGCASLVTDDVVVKVTPPIKVTVYPADTIVYGGAQVPLLATSAGTNYVWSNTTGVIGLNNPNIPDPIATAPMAEGDVVVYKVSATTSAGCLGEAYARIQVYKGPELYVVSGFSPNGDGKNDVFIPISVGIKQINYFSVVNRWGQVVFSTTELNKGWDGRYYGKEQPSGAYVWMVQGVTMDNKLITKKGTVILIR